MGSRSFTDLSLEGQQTVPRPRTTKNYGQRLLPQVIDETALENPSLVIGLTAKSSTTGETPYEFIPLTVSQFADAVNHMSHWLDGILGKDSKQVIGFIGLQVSLFLAGNVPLLLKHPNPPSDSCTNSELSGTGFQIPNP